MVLEIHRVSSVLNKDNKNYGKKNLIDGSEESCWNSEAVRFIIFVLFNNWCISDEYLGFSTMDTNNSYEIYFID